MLLVSKHYQEADAVTVLAEALERVIYESAAEAIFFCIGSDRHLLDSFGPLTGSMIEEQVPEAIVYGTLDEPLQARNLPSRILAARKENPDKIEIAIDASMGSPGEIGMVRLRQGALLPGKAVARRLPPVGHYSLTGIVGSYRDKAGPKPREFGSLANIYHLSQMVTAAIAECYRKQANREW